MLKEIQKIRDKYQDPVFRMALDHMIRKGMDNFDNKTVADSKASFRGQEAFIIGEGKTPILSVPMQDAIIDCAVELSKLKTTDILRFVKHCIHLKGNEKLTRRCKNCDNVLLGDDETLVNDAYEDSFYECDLCHSYSMEDGSVILCEYCDNYFTPNHIKKNSEETCPYCSE